MKAQRKNIKVAVPLIGLIMIVAIVSGARAGELDPPAAPAPTMKTLEEIKPQVPINAINTPGDTGSLFIISQPGAYYFTGNIRGISGQNGIVVQADDVTLDLNGFSLVGLPGSLDGIAVPSSQINLEIKNGVIRDWGGDGVDVWFGRNSRAFGLRISNNGGTGLRFGTSVGIYPPNTTTGCIVQDCVSESNGGDGIFVGGGSTVSGCVGSSNTGIGIRAAAGSTVLHCTASSNSNAGFSIGAGSTISYCSATNNNAPGSTPGIITAQNCTISYCSSTNNRYGIIGSSGCVIISNSCLYNQDGGNGYGIGASGLSRIEGNSVAGNDIGIESLDGGRNLIIRNSAANNSPNYSIGTGNFTGPIINTSGTITSTNPWANFEL